MDSLLLYSYILAAFWLPSIAWAQVDTSASLPTVEVMTTALREVPVGSQVTQWDSAAIVTDPGLNLADLLVRESNIFVKSYGRGSIATTSIRGGSAGHTAVLWNGLSLQSPMLGLLDLSLIPIGVADEIQVELGGNSALWGSGAIGGLIKLNSNPAFKKSFSSSIHYTAGSFGNREQQMNVRWNSASIAVKTQLLLHRSTNDFNYQVRPDLPLKQQSNAAVKQKSLQQELHFKGRKGQKFSLFFWWQDSDRQIPPTSTQNRSLASQRDYFNRTSFQWEKTGRRSILKVRTGFFNETIDFRDPQIGLEALTRFTVAIGEIENQWQLSDRQWLQVGFNETYTKAHSENYSDPPSEYRTALFAAFRRSFDFWKIQINVRQAWLNDRMVPLIPALGITGTIHPHLVLKAKVGRNYRIPTLNDRYWIPGGNENLSPERGWSQELTLAYRSKVDKPHFSYSATAFNRHIKDWILWSLREGDSYFSAHNIAQVWSRGIEQRISFQKNGSNWGIRTTAGHDFIRSTNQQDIENPKIAAGEQLIYVPRNRVIGSLSVHWKNFRMTYQHTFTGAVSGITDQLESYHLGYSRLQYRWLKGAFRGQVFVEADNVWNNNYRVIERRPMPGRHYNIGINLQFHKK